MVTICLISFYPPGVKPDMARLRAGAEINADSFGWALTGGGGVETRTTLDLEEALASFEAARGRRPLASAVFHSRWLTEGAPGIANAQPLVVEKTVEGEEEAFVFAHNGTLFAVPEGDGRSDSLIFAQERLPALLASRDEGDAVLRQLCAQTGSRMILVPEDIGLDGEHAPAARLYGVWERAGEEYHSNSDFIAAPAARPAAWAEGMALRPARELLRRLGDLALLAAATDRGGDQTVATKLNVMRGELLATLPAIRKGENAKKGG